MKSNENPVLALLVLWCVSFSAIVMADVTHLEEKPVFEVENANLWSSLPGATESSYKLDAFDFHDKGTLDSVVGVDLTGTTASYRGEPTFICPGGTFASTTVEGFLPGDPFDVSQIDVNTQCYSCPDGYTHNPALPANVDGVCFRIGTLTRASLKGSAELFCPADQFISADFSGCYSCPSGYDHNPLLSVGTPGVCSLNTTATQGKQIGCFGGEFPNTTLQECYSCPSGYDHNPLLPVDTSGVCSDTVDATHEGDVSLCPSGYSYTGVLCSKKTGESCTDVCIGVEINGVCVGGETEVCTPTYDTKPVGAYCSGGFPTVAGCYSCPSGYSDNGFYQCVSNKTATYEHSYGCTGGSFDGLNGYCYGCESGYVHNPLLSIATPGVCHQDTVADRDGDVQYICPAGQFYDLKEGRCAGCSDGFLHNPLLFADTPGVCYEQVNRGADHQGGVALEGCDADAFYDLVSGKCYACPAGTSWNPAVSVDTSGVCVGLTVGPRDGADFLLGFEVDYDYKYRFGISGGVQVDPGSVSVGYSPTFEINVTEDAASGPGHYTISTAQLPGQSDLNMSSTWPRQSLQYDNYIDNYNKSSVRIYYPELQLDGWHQRVSEQELWDTTSGGEHNYGHYLLEDDSIPLLDFTIGYDGIDFSLVGINLPDLLTGGLFDADPFDLSNKDARPGGLFDPPLELTDRTLNDLARKLLRKSVVPQLDGVTIDNVIVEVGLGLPSMDTPVETSPPYEGNFTETKSLAVYGSDSFIRHTIESGDRNGIEYFALNSGLKEPDVLRTEIDIDGLVAMSTGVFTGKKISQPSGIPLVDLWSLNVSALDLDEGVIMHLRKDLKFEPNPMVTLLFSKFVQVKTKARADSFKTVRMLTVPVGTQVQMIHPGGELRIETLYGLDENRFESDVDLMATFLTEGEIGTFDFRSPLISKTVLPKVSLARWSTPTWPEPLKVADLNHYNAPDRTVYPLPFEAVAGGTLSLLYGPQAACNNGTVSLEANKSVALDPSAYFAGSAGTALPVTLSLSRSVMHCKDIGTQPLSLSITDANGAVDSCTAEVTVTDASHFCTPYSVSFSLYGLREGEWGIVQNNGGDDMNISANGTYTFSGYVYEDSVFDVSVLQRMLGEDRECYVYEGNGTIVDSNITDVRVVCTLAADIVRVPMNRSAIWVLLVLMTLASMYLYSRRSRLRH